MKLATIYPMTSSCIYGLINESDKKIYISYSKNLLVSISRILSKDRNIINDREKIEIILLGEIDRNNDNMNKLIVENLKEDYRNKGYIIYNNTVSISYSIVSKIISEDGFYKTAIYLETKGKTRYKIKVFDKNEDAIKFINDLKCNRLVWESNRV